MRRFVISIRELVDNPAYDSEKAARAAQYSHYSSEDYAVPSQIEVQSLSFSASEEQFNAIRKSALESM